MSLLDDLRRETEIDKLSPQKQIQVVNFFLTGTRGDLFERVHPDVDYEAARNFAERVEKALPHSSVLEDAMYRSHQIPVAEALKKFESERVIDLGKVISFVEEVSAKKDELPPIITLKGPQEVNDSRNAPLPDKEEKLPTSIAKELIKDLSEKDKATEKDLFDLFSLARENGDLTADLQNEIADMWKDMKKQK